MADAESTPPDRSHYSYTHYADRGVAEGFDALRFSGPIGELLARTQAELLTGALAPLAAKSILDVGTGTGRAALTLAAGGAHVLGLDASAEMVRVGARRASEARLAVHFGLADAHALPLANRAFDAAISLRVLMHATDWRRCLSELCRVARWRVIVDFPARASFAALESGGRRIAAAMGRRTEPYRVMAEADVRAAFASHGYRVIDVRRQFVLPIALHKKLASAAATTAIERSLAGVGLQRLLGSPVTMVAER
jgi:SAM-dependent methyltransferase